MPSSARSSSESALTGASAPPGAWAADAGRAGGRRRPRRAGAAAPAGPGTTRRAAPGRTGRPPGRGPRGAVPAGEWYDEQIRGTCRFPSSADSRRPLRARAPEARPARRTQEPYSVRRIPKTSTRSPMCCRCMAVEGKWPSRAPAPRTAWPPCRGTVRRQARALAIFGAFTRTVSLFLRAARFPAGRPGFRRAARPGGKAARDSPAFTPGGADGRQGRPAPCRAPMPSSRYSRPAAKFPSQSSSVM